MQNCTATWKSFMNLALGREVIAAQGPREFLSQDLEQDLRAA
jgi:hypothetical protein